MLMILNKKIFEFVSKMPNGTIRNGSTSLKTLVDREYQRTLKKKEVIRYFRGGITLR